LLPKASTNLSVAKALDLSGRLVEDLRQVSRTPKRVCTWTGRLDGHLRKDQFR